MNVSKTAVIERVARVLAAQHLSANADGGDPSAAEAVDAEWEAHRDGAIHVLKTLREPDPAMAAAGDVVIWERMIAAALGTHLPDGNLPVEPVEPPEPGTDPLHEGP